MSLALFIHKTPIERKRNTHTFAQSQTEREGDKTRKLERNRKKKLKNVSAGNSLVNQPTYRPYDSKSSQSPPTTNLILYRYVENTVYNIKIVLAYCFPAGARTHMFICVT